MRRLTVAIILAITIALLLFAPLQATAQQPYVPTRVIVADFTFTVNGPTVFFDASNSRLAGRRNFGGESAAGVVPVVDASTGSIVSYRWNFGDGSTGSGVTTTHTYGNAGTYNVTLTVTDDRGNATSTTKAVTVGLPSAAAPRAFPFTGGDLMLLSLGIGAVLTGAGFGGKYLFHKRGR